MQHNILYGSVIPHPAVYSSLNRFVTDFEYIIKTFKELGFEATIGQGGTKGSIVFSHRAKVVVEITVRARPIFIGQRGNHSWYLQVSGTDMHEEFSLQEAVEKAQWWLLCSELEYEKAMNARFELVKKAASPDTPFD